MVGSRGGTKLATVHNFEERLAYSQKASHEPFWAAVYRKAFPDMVDHMLSYGNTEAQRNGIDRFVALNNGRVLRIDEKKSEKDWPTILLEHISNDRTHAPGWIEKNLHIDYLAYAFMPSKTVYLFDWLMLRRAWRHYKSRWLKEYKIVTAENSDYNTLCVAVPIKVLTDAVKLASVIQVNDDEIEAQVTLPF